MTPDTFLPSSSTARWMTSVTSLRITSICVCTLGPSCPTTNFPPTWIVAPPIHPLRGKALLSPGLPEGQLCCVEFSAMPSACSGLCGAFNASMILSGGIGSPNATPSRIPILGRYLYENGRCSGISLSKPVCAYGQMWVRIT